MAEDKSFELMPYFMWKINDISVLMIESPIFSVNDVNLRMLYHRGESISALYMIQEAGYQQSSVSYYDIKTSVSIIDPDKSFEDLYCIQKKTTHCSSSGRKAYHLIWKIEKNILNNLFMVQEENGMKNVTFLCVFGPFCEYQKNVADVDDPWREFQCMERLGKDLNDLRLKEDSSFELKCGDKTLKAHKVILSARSKKFYDMFRNEKVSGMEVEIKDMEFEVLENFITYIYSGRLKDGRPSAALLKKLYNAAYKYEVKSLKSMTSFRLTEILKTELLPNGQEVLDKEKLLGAQEVLDKEKLSGGQEVLDKEKLLGGQEVLDKEKLPGGQEVLDTEKLPGGQEVLDTEKLPGGQEVLDTEKLLGGQEVLNKEKLPGGQEVLDKEKLPNKQEVHI